MVENKLNTNILTNDAKVEQFLNYKGDYQQGQLKLLVHISKQLENMKESLASIDKRINDEQRRKKFY